MVLRLRKTRTEANLHHWHHNDGGTKRKFNICIVFQVINFQDSRTVRFKFRVFLGGFFVVFGLVKHGCCWSMWSASTWPEAVSLLPGLNISYCLGRIIIYHNIWLWHIHIYNYIFIYSFLSIYIHMCASKHLLLEPNKSLVRWCWYITKTAIPSPSCGWRSLHNLLWSLNHLLHDLMTPTNHNKWFVSKIGLGKLQVKGRTTETWEFVFMYTRLRFRSSYHWNSWYSPQVHGCMANSFKPHRIYNLFTNIRCKKWSTEWWGPSLRQTVWYP